MYSFFRLVLLGLPLVGSVVSEPAASPTKETHPIYANAEQAFQDLLNALPEESLHVALNGLTRFKDGIFESGRHGVERVHNENPPLATRLIVAAVQDLKKRQTPPTNGTSTQPASSQAPSSQAPSSNPSPASSRESAVIVPVPITTTNSAGEATVVSSGILSQPTASVAVPVTRTNDQGSTIVATETKPAVIFTATDSAGSAFVTTSAVDFAPTQGQVLTTTNAEGSTFLTTYTPGGGKVSSIVLITTTGSDGRPSVITSYTFVGPAQATGTDGKPLPSGATSVKPGLQSGAADRNRAMEAAMVGGAVGGAFALWI
ncbi:uncharacterized protein BDR25DRAFT_304868 [Lindgomyces ingoldianus]|uniref:Uncharacterized protein n=1 Tax=Lindgomyces ingoldianus TaxID=673940 RepID=A0ACB6QPT2_9PLEO|nr:uncharacterized protein BDR25DRAFT_304868 [Lindgomyces ingoldianus]KAF2468978.1 hypothetical protein BDR25DRAFT_304868 [Lindgomyces ingoldianus]